ncbi:DUF1592 domain-containing protein [Planctomycetaceae bacterium SH139]
MLFKRRFATKLFSRQPGPRSNGTLSRGMLLLLASLSLIAGGRASADEQLARWQATYQDEILPILKARCWECHNAENAEGEFSLSPFADGAAAAAKLDVWDPVGRRIRLNEMPPAGSPGLSDPQKAALQRWLDTRPKQDLCNQLATDETQSWYRGHVMSRRLTQTEYSRAMHDLLGVAVPASVELPSDGAGGEGFDTTGDTLFTSPVLIEAYLRAADLLVDHVVLGEPLPETAPPGMAEDNPNAGWAIRDSELLRWEPDAEVSEPKVRQVLAQFAGRAWRRPLSQDELDRLWGLYQAERQRGATARRAAAQCWKASLVSPNFLFIVERESESGVQPLSAHELAARLALFIWSSVPDQELLSLADTGEILQPDVIRGQVTRMLADPRADALGANFGLQWLGLADLARKIQPDESLFPEFDPELVADMRREAIATIASVFRDNQPLDYLISAPQVYANQRLATHYGLPWEAADAQWQAIPVTDGRRGGVLTMGAVLASTSYPRRTSPVLRGAWILAEVLGDAVPPPPPGVPPLEESTTAEVSLSLRQQLEKHRENKQCASCHDRMDPLGFGLENYDALGRWRDREGETPIDASGKLPAGQSFAGPAELKAVIGQRGPEFRRHFVRKLLGFALGRKLNKFDQCVIDECMKQLDENEYRATCVIETICLSYPFRHRYYKPSESES